MKKIIKKSLCSILALAMMLACVACGESKTDTKDKQVDVAGLAAELKSGITYADTLEERDKDFAVNIFELGDNAALIVNQVTYFNTGASAEAVSVVECKDGTDAAKVKTAFEAYAKKQADVYRSYNPEEADKLDKAVVKIVGGKYVAFCVSGDSNKASEIMEK